jgi:biopolymer transport protein ExbB
MLNTLIQDGAQDAADILATDEPVEKTLSIIDLLLTGGTAGIIIIAVLFVLLFVLSISILKDSLL